MEEKKYSIGEIRRAFAEYILYNSAPIDVSALTNEEFELIFNQFCSLLDSGE